MIYKFTFLEKILLRFNIIPHPIIDSMTVVVAGRAIQVCSKIGVFDYLGKIPVTIEYLAEKTKTNPEGLLQLISPLEALGYLGINNNNGVTLTNIGEKFFNKESKSSMINTTLFANYIFESLQNLEQNVKQEKPKAVNLNSFTYVQWEIFNNAMLEIASSNAKEISRLVPLLKGYKKMLDMGGSHGLYAMEISKRLSSLNSEVMDLKPVEQFANTVIKQYKMSDRVKFRVGDFLKDSLGGKYDVVLAFNIIHGLNSKI